MGPIIGMGRAIGVHGFEHPKRAFRTLILATIFSVATSFLYFLFWPLNDAHSELLARTSPTIYDVFIGFFGGAAGILAIGSKVKGNVIPGVAIATALMPPLCTVGYGLATWQMNYFFGALYLFFINSVFIACATTLGVKLMHYAPHSFSNPARARRVRNLITTIAVLTMLPAAYLTFNMLQENNFKANCGRFVDDEFNFDGTQVLNYKAVFTRKMKTLTVSLVGKVLPKDSLMIAMTDKLPDYHLGGTRLRIIQGDASSGNVDVAQVTSGMLRDMYQVTQATIARQQTMIDSLKTACSEMALNDSASAIIAPEIKVLFPEVQDIAVTRGIVSNISTNELDTLNIALVKYSRAMSRQQSERFQSYLEARLRKRDITIVPTTVIGTTK